MTEDDDKTLQEEMDELREAVRDLGYAIFKALGIVRLCERIPWLRLKPWVRERQIKDEWKP